MQKLTLFLIAAGPWLAWPATAGAEDCARALASNEVTLTPPRALAVPVQLGFVRADAFARTVLETRQRYVAHLGADGRGRDWSLTLDAIYPESTFSSVAYFTATRRDSRTPAPHEPAAPATHLRVTFNQLTGEVRRFVVPADDEPPGPVTNVRLAQSVAREIERLTTELVVKVQHGDYRSKDNAERAATHRRLRIGRTFCGSNHSTVWIEVNLKVLVENSAGGLASRVFNLVYSISPTQHVHLRAADDPDVLPFVAP